MTENEAKNVLGNVWDFAILADDESGDILEKAIDIANKALEEIQAYRAIGTVEECRNAVERMKPKKPKSIDVDYGTFICSNCGHTIIALDDMTIHENCLMCGQKLDWSE